MSENKRNWVKIDVDKEFNSKTWAYRDMEPPAELEGKYLGKKENVGANNQTIYQMDDGKEIWDVFNSTVLDGKMEDARINEGDYIKIVYLGKPDKKKYYNFEVYKDMPEEIGVEF